MDAKTRFLNACYRLPVDKTPVWIMRQAGRYMKPYQNMRKRYSFLRLCQSPDLATKITMLPLKRLGVDAAILFSDLLIPFLGMGFEVKYKAKIGPQIKPSVRDEKVMETITTPDPERDFPYLRQSIKQFNKKSKGYYPLIGFAGAPFTMASYLIEGGSSHQFQKTKLMMYQEPHRFKRLLEKVTAVLIDYCQFQVESGLDAIQIFDTWAGCLTPLDFREYALPFARQIINSLKSYQIPTIYFLKGSSGLLKDIFKLGTEVISLDSFQELSEARKLLGPNVAVQGNLDPMALFLPKDKLKQRINSILEQNGNQYGHIFNLGHGVLPTTDEDQVSFLVRTVHEYSNPK
ncbi:uroporphyrinogen decarboxylase [candidate division CSSED10-310 bacterium]|uniref:Uroporphyrinogen decarboxylase n=1 Tax=candidate division CSSED10-310 bacterium TaxID=2855610 RepID=A0ABV6YRY0_UNCC1